MREYFFEMFNKIALLEAGKSLGCGGRVGGGRGKEGRGWKRFLLRAVKLADILVLFLGPGRDGGAEAVKSRGGA